MTALHISVPAFRKGSLAFVLSRAYDDEREKCLLVFRHIKNKVEKNRIQEEWAPYFVRKIDSQEVIKTNEEHQYPYTRIVLYKAGSYTVKVKETPLISEIIDISLQRGDPGQATDDDDEFPESPHDRQRRREEMFQQYPSMRGDSEADYWMDLADDLGCDPETLRANLD